MGMETSEGVVLERTTSHKILGLYIDQELSFNDQWIGTLKSIRHYLPLNERLPFYNATAKPVMVA